MKKGIIFMLLCAIFFIGGFGCSSEKKQDEEIIEKITKEELTEEEIDELFTIVQELEFLDLYVIEFDTISDDDLLTFAFSKNNEKGEIYSKDISLEKVNEIANQYFGKDVKPDDIKCWRGCNQIFVKYNESNENFTFNDNYGGHGFISADIFNRYASSYKVDNTYTFVVYKAFTNAFDIGEVNQLYNTYEDALNNENVILDYSDKQTSSEELENEFNVMDPTKLKEYTYIFEKKNSTFILRSLNIN